MTMSKYEMKLHRKIASTCFNQAWDYLERKKRSSQDDIRMLSLAHTSMYHWGLLGKLRNLAIGQWQLSRVYADIGHPQLALKFAKSCLASCKRNHLSDMAHTANEGMARAYALSKEYAKAQKYLGIANRQLDKLKLDKEDRAIYLGQIAETESLIRA
jgi:hypothetical protein